MSSSTGMIVFAGAALVMVLTPGPNMVAPRIALWFSRNPMIDDCKAPRMIQETEISAGAFKSQCLKLLDSVALKATSKRATWKPIARAFNPRRASESISSYINSSLCISHEG